MQSPIRRVLMVSGLILSGGLLIGIGNPAWAQRSSADSSRVGSSRGSTDSRAVQSERSRSDARTRTNRGSSSARTGRTESRAPSDARTRTDSRTDNDARTRSDDRSRSEARERTESGARSGSESRTRTDSRTRNEPRARTDSDSRARTDRQTRTDRDASRTRSDADRTRTNTRGDVPSRAQRDADQRRRQSPTVRRPSRPQPQVHQRVRVDVSWPWEHRYNRGWSPTYRYRQVVHADAGWGRHSRQSRLDVRTYYRHRVRSANRNRAHMDVVIERIEIFENGYYVGSVRHIPQQLARIQATMYRGGAARFDRDLLIVGDPHTGFEMISTRHYGGFVLDQYQRSHGFRVGVLDLRHERVRQVRRSRLFDPYDFQGFVPVRLLPQDEAWIGDYGYNAPSRHWYGDDDVYYYGYPEGWGDGIQYDQIDPRSSTSGRSSALPQAGPLQRSDEETYRTESGAEIRLKREMSLERVD